MTDKPKPIKIQNMRSKDKYKGGGKKPVDFQPGQGTVRDMYAKHGTGKEKC